MARRRTGSGAAEKSGRVGDALHGEPVGDVASVSGRRRSVDRQQRGGTRNEGSGVGPQELAVRSEPIGGTPGGDPDESGGQREGESGGTVGVAAGCVRETAAARPVANTRGTLIATPRPLAGNPPRPPLAHRRRETIRTNLQTTVTKVRITGRSRSKKSFSGRKTSMATQAV